MSLKGSGWCYDIVLCSILYFTLDWQQQQDEGKGADVYNVYHLANRDARLQRYLQIFSLLYYKSLEKH